MNIFGDVIEDRAGPLGVNGSGEPGDPPRDRGPRRQLTFTTHRDDSLPKNSLCG